MTALVKLKECEDTHLGEEVDRNWAEVATQQYVFNRLHREVRHTHQTIQFFCLWCVQNLTLLSVVAADVSCISCVCV